MIFERTNARLGNEVRLVAEFFSGGQYYDPALVDRVEIYKGGDRVENGGVLVDVIQAPNIINFGVGMYEVYASLFDGASPSPASPEQVVYTPNQIYYDSWIFREKVGQQETHSVGLHFFVYPENSFVCDDIGKFRFEMKVDRKRIVKGEVLDMRLQIIPIPLYISRRDPIVDYLLPISTMRARVIDPQNNELVPWTPIRFTGKEGILPTNLFSALQLGEYHVIAELTLPNGQIVRYPRTPVMLVD